jgi:DnaK suppressor protein
MAQTKKIKTVTKKASVGAKKVAPRSTAPRSTVTKAEKGGSGLKAKVRVDSGRPERAPAAKAALSRTASSGAILSPAARNANPSAPGKKPLKLKKRPEAIDGKRLSSPAALPERREKRKPIPIIPLSKRIAATDLRAIKNSLLDRRRELVGSIDAIQAEYLGTRENSTTTGGDEADMATNSVTADLSLRLAESETRELKDIDDALRKIEDGSYGICEVTAKPIDVRRLLARPAARLSIEAQKELEAQRIHYDETMGWVTQEE